MVTWMGHARDIQYNVDDWQLVIFFLSINNGITMPTSKRNVQITFRGPSINIQQYVKRQRTISL